MTAKHTTRILLALAAFIVVTAGSIHAQGQVQSPVDRLIHLETVLFGAGQDGAIQTRIENMEKLLFGETGKESLPDRLNTCWAFVQGDRVGTMNLQYKLRTVEWTMYARVTDGPIAVALESLEQRLVGRPQPGPIGRRLDDLMRLTLPSGRADTGYVVLPKGQLVKVRLLTQISSSRSRPGDIVRFEVASDIVIEGRLAIPAGMKVDARVIDTARPSRLGARSRVDLEFSLMNAIDSSPISLGVDQSVTGANPGLVLASGESLRRFAILGREGVLGGVVSPGAEVELGPDTEFFVAVMQSAKVLGLKVP